MFDDLMSTDIDIALLHAMVDIDMLASGKSADLARIRQVAEILEQWLRAEPNTDLALGGLREVLLETSSQSITTISDLIAALREETDRLKKTRPDTDVATLERSKRFCILFHRAFLAEMAATNQRCYLAA